MTARKTEHPKVVELKRMTVADARRICAFPKFGDAQCIEAKKLLELLAEAEEDEFIFGSVAWPETPDELTAEEISGFIDSARCGSW